MKRINSSYKLVEFLSGRRSGADTVVNVATIEFRFRTIVLIEKFVLDVAYEKIGVAGSHFCAQKRDDLNKQILQCRSELSKICPAILVHSIRTKIQEVNAKLFNHRRQTYFHYGYYISLHRHP